MDKRPLYIILNVLWISVPGMLSAAVAGTVPQGAIKTAMQTNAAAPAKPSDLPVPVVSRPVPDYLTYNYYGDRYRDPFIALNGEYRSEQGADRPPQISSLLLKGIIQDEKGRIALLTSGVSSYILRGGKLYDGRNHLMKGISGVIKSNSVVLMGSDRTVKELKVSVTL